MNRFCANLLLFIMAVVVFVAGMLACKAGIMAPDWETKARIQAILFGGFAVLAGPLLGFAACLGWRKAWDAETTVVDIPQSSHDHAPVPPHLSLSCV